MSIQSCFQSGLSNRQSLILTSHDGRIEGTKKDNSAKAQYRYLSKIGVFALVCLTLLAMTISTFRNPSLIQQTTKFMSSTNTLEVPVTSEYEFDVMPEDVALKFPACTNPKLAADPETSKLSITGTPKTVYKIGDTILVSVRLYDSYHKPLTKGGAILRPRMFNKDKKAYATALVTDHGDGTYTTQFEASWSGKSTIKITIAYTPETIRAVYYIRKKLPATIDMMAIFSVHSYSEATHCHPDPEGLRQWNYSRLCNLTGDNSGMPYYCGKPSNVHLLCEDWTGQKRFEPPELPITDCESKLIDRYSQNNDTIYRAGKDIKQSIEVNVAGENTILPLPKNPCRDFDVTSLWTRKHPTGFMYGDKWNLGHCKGHEPKELFSCLKNRKFLLFGDSTVRRWYARIIKDWQCVATTERWTTDTWHKRTECINKQHNFSVQWLPHSQPFLVIHELSRYTKTSISRHLDETGNNENVVAVLYIYYHITVYHHSVIRQRIQIIRRSVENLLNRNKFVKFFIKGPQTAGTRRSSDYYGLVHRQIWYEEFAGLHDKVVYLDHGDINKAMAVPEPHPPDTVDRAMIEQMLAYLC